MSVHDDVEVLTRLNMHVPPSSAALAALGLPRMVLPYATGEVPLATLAVEYAISRQVWPREEEAGAASAAEAAADERLVEDAKASAAELMHSAVAGPPFLPSASAITCPPHANLESAWDLLTSSTTSPTAPAIASAGAGAAAASPGVAMLRAAPVAAIERNGGKQRRKADATGAGAATAPGGVETSLPCRKCGRGCAGQRALTMHESVCHGPLMPAASPELSMAPAVLLAGGDEAGASAPAGSGSPAGVAAGVAAAGTSDGGAAAGGVKKKARKPKSPPPAAEPTSEATFKLSWHPL